MCHVYEEQRRIYFSEIPQFSSESYQQLSNLKIAKLCQRSAHSLAIVFGAVTGRLAHGDPIENICTDELLPNYRSQSFLSTPIGGKASGIADMMLLVASVQPDLFAHYAYGQGKGAIVSHLNGPLHAWLLELQTQWNSVRQDVNTDRTSCEVQILTSEKEKVTLGRMLAALVERLCIGQPRPSRFIAIGASFVAEQFRVKHWPSSDAIKSQLNLMKCVAAELSAHFQEWNFIVGKTNIRQRSHKESRPVEDASVSIRDIFHRNALQCIASASEISCDGECMEEVYGNKSQSSEQFIQLYRSTIHIINRKLLHSNIRRQELIPCEVLPLATYI